MVIVAPSSSRVASAGGVSSEADDGADEGGAAWLGASEVEAIGVPADDAQPASATLTLTARMNGSRELGRVN
jgi:hypothetical protein